MKLRTLVTSLNVSYCHVLRREGYILTLKYQLNKRRRIAAKATPAAFIGYESESKGYRLRDNIPAPFRCPRDVTVDESSFPLLIGR